MSLYEETELTLLNEKYDIDFLIVTATDIELEKSIELLCPLQDKIIKTYSRSNTFYCGLYGLYTCAIVKTNQMGAVLSGAALQTTTESIEAIKPKAVIMGGIALGKNSNKQKLGDILVSKSIILYEQARVNEGGKVDYRGPKIEASRFLINRLTQGISHQYTFNDEVKSVNILGGPILTGEKLIDDPVFKTVLFEQFPDAIGGEMEAAAIYAACNNQSIPWIIVKSICDWADGNKNKTFQAEAGHIVFSFIHKSLNSSIAFRDIDISPYTVNKHSSEINLINAHKTTTEKIEISDDQLIAFLAEEYPDVASARSLWKRSGGKNGDISNINRPRDMWQSIWQMSVNGASVTPEALLNEISKDYPNSTLIQDYLSQLPTTIQ
jgi:nucleoside phosphorylase